MERITSDHVFFWGSEFSNWAAITFRYRGKLFNTSEHAFMWEKANYFNDQEIAETILRNTLGPSEVKELGRQVKDYDDTLWAKVRYGIMVNILIEKFDSDETLRNTLLMTGTRTIVEASPYDRIWGIGYHWTDPKMMEEQNNWGENLLGKALMDTREILRRRYEYPEEE